MYSYSRLSIFGIVALVALRLCIGWHFYMEGVSKVQGKNFTSVGFLKAAKGPLADNYQALIWDHDGRVRLDADRVKGMFQSAADASVKHFGLTEDQIKPLPKLRDRYVAKLDEIYGSGRDDIYKYLRSQERLQLMDRSGTYQVASMQGQKEKVEAELLGAVQPTLDSIDAVWTQYEQRLNGLATPAQLRSRGYYRLVRPGEGVMSTRVVDRILPIFDMVIGILLILGLLTPVASLAAAAFLLSVILSQMPGFPGTQPTYFQAVECLALVVLAGTDAGRYAGLDFLAWAWWNRKPSLPTQPASV